MARVPTDPELLQRVLGAELPGGNGLDFAQRLAVTQFLSGDEAIELVEEYRRFLYLAALAEGPRVPAEGVALAWRLHALHADYLGDFCPRVLGKPLPYIAQPGEGPGLHVPESAIALAPEDLHLAYRRARTDYALEFAESPARRFWPYVPPRDHIVTAQVACLAAFGALGIAGLMLPIPWLVPVGLALGLILFIFLAFRSNDSRGWRRGVFDWIRGSGFGV